MPRLYTLLIALVLVVANLHAAQAAALPQSVPHAALSAAQENTYRAPSAPPVTETTPAAGVEVVPALKVPADYWLQEKTYREHAAPAVTESAPVETVNVASDFRAGVDYWLLEKTYREHATLTAAAPADLAEKLDGAWLARICRTVTAAAPADPMKVLCQPGHANAAGTAAAAEPAAPAKVAPCCNFNTGR